jgi:hypothetical protein
MSIQPERHGRLVMPNPIVCTLKQLPRELWVSAAKKAAEINPINHAQSAA